ncbi:MAG: Chk1 protein kinase [Vezdaea aestivalis]|nr:MAG: Chk1 protein kinase [Vezdaea aestivalis]
MSTVIHSQLDPIPSDLPFRIVSQTVGRGAYASIKKAIPIDQPTPVFAVKFIHKAYATRHGRISAKQIAMEVKLHDEIKVHPHIIQFFTTGEDPIWRWIAMEYAGGGDLFDKIEADVGVNQDIAHLYFTQLVSAVCWMHGMGIAHRDIKPENILLSESGDLKLADFGLATLFAYKGVRKNSATMCGSPPYIAPEVLRCGKTSKSQPGKGYEPDLIDIWSCAVVLFVLLVGNTPWDEPTESSWEFAEFTNTAGRSTDELWQKLPSQVLSLLRGMMKLDPHSRLSLDDVQKHPWYTRPNQYLSADGKMDNQLTLATTMLESLKIDFTAEPKASQSSSSMDIDSDPRISATQPEAALEDALFDLDRPQRLDPRISASQPSAFGQSGGFGNLADDPSMSQFIPASHLSQTLTQAARRFQDILPAHSLTTFPSTWPRPVLQDLVASALHRLNVPVAGWKSGEGGVWLRVKTRDERGCGLAGEVMVEAIGMDSEGAELLEVRFVKGKGDPLEWRRFFKKVTVFCKEAVFIPE